MLLQAKICGLKKKIEVETSIKYGPLLQSIKEKSPEINVPEPITTLTKPKSFVETSKLSSKTAVPLIEF